MAPICDRQLQHLEEIQMFKSVFGLVIASLMFCVKLSMADKNNAAVVNGTSVATSGDNTFDAETGAGVNQAGSSDPISPYCPDIAGKGNAPAGSSGGAPEINGNYTFGAHQLKPGGSGGSAD